MLPRAKLERVLGLMVKRSLFLREQEAHEEEELMKSYPEAHEVDIPHAPAPSFLPFLCAVLNGTELN
jgi:hypothetical protein